MSINATLFFQIIVFFVLVWFTMKFVWPPITKALDERAQKIADGLSAAERAKTELAAADQLVKKELAQASNETASRLADADRRAQAIIEEAMKRPELNKRFMSTFRAGVPQIYLDIDRTKAEKMGVLMSDIFATLQAKFAIVGHTLYRTVNPDGSILYLAGKWGYFRELKNLEAVAAFLAMIGGQA